MKRFAILVVALAILATGMAMADRGVDPTPETQGITISTSIIAVGNFDASTDVQWTSVDGTPGVMPVPPLAGSEAYYASSFSADTQSLGTGIIAYDRQTDIDTSAQVSGQYNIESEMVLGYVGIDLGRVTSSEQIMVDGAALPTQTAGQVICPFAAQQATIFPAYCNRAEAGSSIDMIQCSVATVSRDRFVMTASDFPVELDSNIRVTTVGDAPSIGQASAFINILIQEARSGQGAAGGNPASLSERIEIHDDVTVDGLIELFDRIQHYESGMVR